jgi:hypothetical protein
VKGARRRRRVGMRMRLGQCAGPALSNATPGQPAVPGEHQLRGGIRRTSEITATATPPVPQTWVRVKSELCRVELVERVVGETHGQPPAFHHAIGRPGNGSCRNDGSRSGLQTQEPMHAHMGRPVVGSCGQDRPEHDLPDTHSRPLGGWTPQEGARRRSRRYTCWSGSNLGATIACPYADAYRTCPFGPATFTEVMQVAPHISRGAAGPAVGRAGSVRRGAFKGAVCRLTLSGAPAPAAAVVDRFVCWW